MKHYDELYTEALALWRQDMPNNPGVVLTPTLLAKRIAALRRQYIAAGVPCETKAQYEERGREEQRQRDAAAVRAVPAHWYRQTGGNNDY